jgi:hypothetical protein
MLNSTCVQDEAVGDQDAAPLQIDGLDDEPILVSVLDRFMIYQASFIL